MRNEMENYKFAPLSASDKAIEIIRNAESAIGEITGYPVTLIAYEKTEQKS